MIRSCLVAWLVVVACAPHLWAEEKENRVIGLTQTEPAFLVHAEVDRADRFYRDGDALTVSVVCEAEAYLYVLYQQADGKVFQIFPNSAQRENKVSGKQTIAIPAKDDTFRWKVGAPFGKEVVKVIASKTQVDVLANEKLRQGRFNQVSPSQASEAATFLQAEEAKTWTESLVEITTAARDAQAPRKQGRRFGVFFGASEYEFNEEAKAAAQGKWQPNLPCCANNAIAMARLMKSMGHLDDFKLCVNKDATKANLQSALTEWLPQVSRPGDTIFIMYCGHGGQLADDNGDEKDGKDEYLLTHDYIDVGIFNQLSKKAQAGTLPEALKGRYGEWRKIVERSGNLERAHNALTRYSCVSDDLLGHWLQRLSGRQILVLLDTCHAGGFANTEKSLRPSAPELDFLDSEIERLKDIGQPESALIAACSAQQSSYGLRARDSVLAEWKNASKGLGEERVVENLAVFSYYLVDGLCSLPPPMNASELQEHCRTGMKDYFVQINEIMRKDGKNPLIEHAPVYYNYSRQPILIKP